MKAAARAEGEFVESGAFGVDRRRALQKLMRFSVPEPGMYLILLVRCAVAGGAKRMELRSREQGAGVEISFDGRPFAADELSFPYAGLFERPVPGRARNRELALALLTVMRLKPDFVELRSGEGAARARLRLSSLEEESVEPEADGGSGTRLTLAGSWHDELWNLDRARFLETNCRLCPIPLLVDGRELPRFDPAAHAPERIVFSERGARGWLGLATNPESPCEIELYRHGARVARVGVELPLAGLAGEVDFGRLTLNASQSGIVRNAGWRALEVLLGRQAKRLLAKQVGLQRRDRERLRSELFAAESRQAWIRRIDRGFGAASGGLLRRAARALGLAGSEEGAESPIDEPARRMLWLRAAAKRHLKSLQSARKDALRRLLRGAALLFDRRGGPLSLEELERLRSRLGFVPFAYEPSREQAQTSPAVWLVAAADYDFLVHYFKAGAWERGAAPVEVFRGAADAAETPALLELAGYSSPLVRASFKREGLRAELGLLAQWPGGGPRLHVFSRGAPRAFRDLPGGLRFAAVVDLADGTTEAEAFSRGRAAAEEFAAGLFVQAAIELRRAPAPDFAPLLCEYLWDYLEHALEPEQGAGRSSARAWLDKAPLFPGPEGAVSLETLRSAIAAGETVFFLKSSAADFPARRLTRFHRFEEKLLRRLFPEAALSPHARRPDVFLAFAKGPSACGHGPEPCLLEWSEGGESLHLNLADGSGEGAFAAPWGAVRIHGKVPKRLPGAAGLALAAAVLRSQAGNALPRGDPRRRLLLGIVRHFFAPWPGTEPARPESARVLELLVDMPLFASPKGEAWSLGRLQSHLTTGRYLPVVLDGNKRRISRALLLLRHEELDLIRALWPRRLEQIVELGAPRPPKVKRKKGLLDQDLGKLLEARLTSLLPSFTPAARVKPAPTPKPALEPGAGRLAARLDELFAALRGCSGLDPRTLPPGKAAFEAVGTRSPLALPGRANWTLNSRHALALQLMPEKLDDALKALYLASLVMSAANRRLATVTDAEDALCQRSLAELAILQSGA